MSKVEIEPWVIALTTPSTSDENDATGNQTLAMWRLQAGDQPALALFSDEARAAAFARQLNARDFQLLHPSRHGLIGLLIQVYRLNVQLAVLDPDQTGARRIFNVRDCLRAAKEQLVSAEDELK